VREGVSVVVFLPVLVFVRFGAVASQGSAGHRGRDREQRPKPPAFGLRIGERARVPPLVPCLLGILGFA
jgi:hypothetical protein